MLRNNHTIARTVTSIYLQAYNHAYPVMQYPSVPVVQLSGHDSLKPQYISAISYRLSLYNICLNTSCMDCVRNLFRFAMLAGRHNDSTGS